MFQAIQMQQFSCLPLNLYEQVYNIMGNFVEDITFI